MTKRRLIVLCSIVACITASWVWHATRPSVWLGKMLDLPGSMRVEHCWIERSRLFYYANAYCDIPCTENDFRSWQASIHGAPVRSVLARFPTEGMPPTVQEWWITWPIDHPIFEAMREGVTVVALWHQGKAFVEFGQRGKMGATWGNTN